MSKWIGPLIVGIITSVVSAIVYENFIKKPAVVVPPPSTQPAPPVKPEPKKPPRPHIPHPWEVDHIK